MVVVNIGMPRSGTLWRYKIVRDLVIAGGGTDGMTIRRKYLLSPFLHKPNADIPTLKPWRLIPASIPSMLGETYVLNTHARPREYANRLLERGKLKAVYGYRDPRDCILSILEYGRRAKPVYSNIFLKIKTVEDGIKFLQPYLETWDAWNSTSNTLVLKYEDMLNDFEKTISQITNYLGLQIKPQDIERITKQYLPAQKPAEGVRTHFEHGQAHRFREQFMDEELSMLRDAYAGYLEKMGYEQ